MDLQHSQRTILLGGPPSAECWSCSSGLICCGISMTKGCTQKTLGWWAEAVHQVYTEAKASVLPRAQPGHRTQRGGETNGLGAAFPDPVGQALPAHGTVHQGTVCLRVGPSRALHAAERSLRHLVTSRKISGGTRSGQGTDSKMTLASLFGTCGLEVSIPSWNAAGCSLPLG